jgi:hypothetical protein
MTVSRVPDERPLAALAEAFSDLLTEERRKVDQSKAMIWSALAVISVMAALVAAASAVPVVIWIFTALL